MCRALRGLGFFGVSRSIALVVDWAVLKVNRELLITKAAIESLSEMKIMALQIFPHCCILAHSQVPRVIFFPVLFLAFFSSSTLLFSSPSGLFFQVPPPMPEDRRLIRLWV